MEIHRVFRITGRVQGVGFRWWTKRTADDLGLGGTVRNLSDGSVEVHVAGSEDLVRAFRELLQVGPPVAVVDEIEDLDVTEPGGIEPFEGFEIRHS